VSGLKPPADIPPARLFRSLLRIPRPIEPLAFRFSVAPTQQLYAQALSPTELAEAREAEDPHLAIAAATLVDRAGARILTVHDIGHIDEIEAKLLATAVGVALARVSPTFGLVDERAWEFALRTGVESDATNMRIACRMGGCLEAVGDRVFSAPDKYFGVARGALLDGHWMAFRVGQAVYEQRRPKG
jgi:hypothetical protein